jgi:hypothetical protein
MPRKLLITSKSPESTPKSTPKSRQNTVKQQNWVSQIAKLLSRKNRPNAKSAEMPKKSKSTTIKYKSLSKNWKPNEYYPRFRHIFSDKEIQEMLEVKEIYDPEIAKQILQEIEGEGSYSPYDERRSNELSRIHEIKKDNRPKEYMGKTKKELKKDLIIWTCLLQIYGFENIPQHLKNIFNDPNNFLKEMRIQEQINKLIHTNNKFKDCIEQ